MRIKDYLEIKLFKICLKIVNYYNEMDAEVFHKKVSNASNKIYSECYYKKLLFTGLANEDKLSLIENFNLKNYLLELLNYKQYEILHNFIFESFVNQVFKKNNKFIDNESIEEYYHLKRLIFEATKSSLKNKEIFLNNFQKRLNKWINEHF